ncbi:MAG TPA: DUF6518 family protein [Streptosporangiaceae bacterium]
MQEAQPLRRTAARRFAFILAISVVFGIVMAWIKGNGAGLSDAVGNVSALWLLLPFLAGASAPGGRVTLGALYGLIATLAALTGFYFAESFVLDLGPHSWLTDLSLTMGAVVYYAERGLVTGPVFGALGLWWRGRGSVVAAGLIAAVFVLEPAAWWLYGLQIGGGAAYPVPGYPALWLTEIAMGAAGFVLLRRLARQQARPA